MPLIVAVQMDPIARIRIAGDSTFALLLEAQARGHRLLHYTPDRLRLSGSRVEAMAEPLEVRDVEGDHASLGEPRLVDLSTGLIYPPQSAILDASLHVAERVAAYIFDNGLARVPRPSDIGALIRARAYHPVYSE